MLKNISMIMALVAALPALAQEAAPHWGAAGQMPSRKGRPDMHQRMLEKFDADKNGQLSEQERAALKAEFEKKRAERGNRAPRPEGKGGKFGPRPEGMENVHPGNRRRPHSERPAMLEKFDTDKDGQLNEQEHKNLKDAVKKHREGRQEKSRERREEFRKGFMEKLDTDKDGKLSDEEKEAAKKQRGERAGAQSKRGPRRSRGERPEGMPQVPATLEL